MNVKAKCKNCGQEAPAEQFKLHFQLKQMVCPNCFSGKKTAVQKAAEKKQEIPRPPGWDIEDEYLEKAARMRREQTHVQVTRIPGSEQVQYTCTNCRYEFKYNPYKKQPSNCPYCNGDIPRVKVF